MTFQSLQAMSPQFQSSISKDVIEDYVSTGTGEAEYAQWAKLNGEVNATDDDLDTDLSLAGWQPTAD